MAHRLETPFAEVDLVLAEVDLVLAEGLRGQTLRYTLIEVKSCWRSDDSELSADDWLSRRQHARLLRARDWLELQLQSRSSGRSVEVGLELAVVGSKSPLGVGRTAQISYYDLAFS